jgi:hypothetical protein
MTTYEETLALEFFNDNYSYVKAFGTSNLEREERVLYRKGEKLLNDQLDIVKKSMKSKKTNVAWTGEEYDVMAECYHRYEGRSSDIIPVFMAFSDRHTENSVSLAIRSCAAMDTLNPDNGMKDHAEGLLNALNAISPGRFKSTR